VEYDGIEPWQPQQRIGRLVVRVAPDVPLRIHDDNTDPRPAAPIRLADVSNAGTLVKPSDEVFDRAVLQPSVRIRPLNASDTTQVVTILQHGDRSNRHCRVTRKAHRLTRSWYTNPRIVAPSPATPEDPDHPLDRRPVPAARLESLVTFLGVLGHLEGEWPTGPRRSGARSA